MCVRVCVCACLLMKVARLKKLTPLLSLSGVMENYRGVGR